MRKAVSVLLVGSLLMLPACQTTGEQVGAGVGLVAGAAVGSLFGSGAGQAVAIGTGAIVGTVVGHALGSIEDATSIASSSTYIATAAPQTAGDANEGVAGTRADDRSSHSEMSESTRPRKQKD